MWNGAPIARVSAPSRAFGLHPSSPCALSNTVTAVGKRMMHLLYADKAPQHLMCFQVPRINPELCFHSHDAHLLRISGVSKGKVPRTRSETCAQSAPLRYGDSRSHPRQVFSAGLLTMYVVAKEGAYLTAAAAFGISQHPPALASQPDAFTILSSVKAHLPLPEDCDPSDVQTRGSKGDQTVQLSIRTPDPICQILSLKRHQWHKKDQHRRRTRNASMFSPCQTRKDLILSLAIRPLSTPCPEDETLLLQGMSSQQYSNDAFQSEICIPKMTVVYFGRLEVVSFGCGAALQHLQHGQVEIRIPADLQACLCQSCNPEFRLRPVMAEYFSAGHRQHTKHQGAQIQEIIESYMGVASVETESSFKVASLGVAQGSTPRFNHIAKPKASQWLLLDSTRLTWRESKHHRVGLTPINCVYTLAKHCQCTPNINWTVRYNNGMVDAPSTGYNGGQLRHAVKATPACRDAASETQIPDDLYFTTPYHTNLSSHRYRCGAECGASPCRWEVFAPVSQVDQQSYTAIALNGPPASRGKVHCNAELRRWCNYHPAPYMSCSGDLHLRNHHGHDLLIIPRHAQFRLQWPTSRLADYLISALGQHFSAQCNITGPNPPVTSIPARFTSSGHSAQDPRLLQAGGYEFCANDAKFYLVSPCSSTNPTWSILPCLGNTLSARFKRIANKFVARQARKGRLAKNIAKRDFQHRRHCNHPILKSSASLRTWPSAPWLMKQFAHLFDAKVTRSFIMQPGSQKNAPKCIDNMLQILKASNPMSWESPYAPLPPRGAAFWTPEHSGFRCLLLIICANRSWRMKTCRVPKPLDVQGKPARGKLESKIEDITSEPGSISRLTFLVFTVYEIPPASWSWKSWQLVMAFFGFPNVQITAKKVPRLWDPGQA
ncbi:uncharacterized protein CLUP02_05365 [Colletotrichum lupini]|uniref:Uncharacterized protein n=1 Tax=Colletotrichum lupini TaxID=145971 RepID=A0A9Q8WE00_9PEZI|nr:uncharacterized protein CLUP02_05365 [Colletotrichum lupini]UQC79884.1 hypothetical protein CLUP02_05365 [Colletotrichum lupini]